MYQPMTFGLVQDAIGDKMYSMICDVCNVKGGGTWRIAQGLIFML